MKKTEKKLQKWLKVSDVAAAEGVSTKTVYYWIKNERIHPISTVGERPPLYLIGEKYTIVEKYKRL